MAVTLPYVSEKFIAYAGDVIHTRLSLAVWLEDEYTGNAPVGRIKIILKETWIEAFQNLSGYYCFVDLPGGDYHLSVESDYYLPIEEPIVIPSTNPQDLSKVAVKYEIKLKPTLSYPFPASATLASGKIISNDAPVQDAVVEGSILRAACFSEQQFDGFLQANPGIENILEPYKREINNSICIHPGEIVEDDKDNLGDAFSQLAEKASHIIKGEACFTHPEYKKYLSTHFLTEDVQAVMKRYEIPKNGKICIEPTQISEADINKIEEDAFNKLMQMANENIKNEACFTVKKYNEYIKKYLIPEDVLTKYEKQKTSKVCIDLDEVALDDKDKLPEKAYEELLKKAARETRTDARGEFVLFFKGFKNKAERIAIKIKKGTDIKTVFTTLNEGTTQYYEIPFP